MTLRRNKNLPANVEALGDLDSIDDVVTSRRLELIANAHCIRENIVDTFSCKGRVSDEKN